jgi:hypothetical protein
MRFLSVLCCLALSASMAAAAAAPASAAPAGASIKHVTVGGGARCTLPTYRNHTLHPVLSARLNKDRTVSFSGTTCPWAFIAVFQVHGHHLRNNAEDLVCDARPNKNGAFACTSLRRYASGSQFGVMISGQFIVGVTGPGKPRTVIHRERPSRPRYTRTGPNTGFGGLARLVGRHHPWRAAAPDRFTVSSKGRSWVITLVLRSAGNRGIVIRPELG